MRPELPTVCVVGLGYIGLPTAALIASRGLNVIGVDVNLQVVATVGAGRVHIIEADLEMLVQKAVRSGRLIASTRPRPAEVFLIAVPTPLSQDKKPMLDYVFTATRSIAPQLKRGDLVILESTSPVGTTEAIAGVLADMRPDLILPNSASGTEADIALAYCPERVLPGRILKELVENDRCVGGLTPACAAKAKRFYEHFVRGECIATTARTAEMVKLTENAFRDTNIAFANELSMVCDRLGIDVWELIALANRHPRVDILKPGPGVGGHCIAVDPWFIVDAAPQETRLIRSAREVNDGKAEYVFREVSKLLDAHPERQAACLGLSFKANIDDLRESPALEITEKLAVRYGKRIAAVEPFITALPAALRAHDVRQLGLDEALAECGILLLLVDHDQFRRVSEQRRAGAVVYDTRGIWGRNAVTAASAVQRRASAA
jgi:UDP-N-acetyl-D-mannosaminuronic acid dehydrogenase